MEVEKQLYFVLFCMGCVAKAQSNHQSKSDVSSTKTQRTVGLYVDAQTLKTIGNSSDIISSNLGECCNTSVILRSDEDEPDLDEITDLLHLSNAGLVTMASCDITSFVAEVAENVGVHHVAIPSAHCSVETLDPHHSTTYTLKATPSILYRALLSLISYVGWKRVQIIYDHTYNDGKLQNLIVHLSEKGTYVTLHLLCDHCPRGEGTLEVFETLEKEADRLQFLNIVTLLGSQNLKDILEMAVDRNLTDYVYAWVVCGGALDFVDPDIQPWSDMNFVIVSPMIYETDESPIFDSNRKNLILNTLTVGCILALELTYPGSLNTTFPPPPIECYPLEEASLPALKGQAAWMAYDKDDMFGDDRYREDFVIGVWGLLTLNGRVACPSLRATWSLQKGPVILHQRIFPSTIDDFGGQVMQVAVYEAAPFVMRLESSNGSVSYKGLCITMLKEIAKRLNFRYELVEPPDKLYGSPVSKDKKKWNGMIGMILRKEVHLAVGPFTVSEDRAKVVTFTTPFMEDKAGIVVHRPEVSQTSQFQVMRPFAPMVWMAIATSILVVGTLLYLVDHLTSWMYEGSRGYIGPGSYVTYLWNIYGHYLEQSTDYQPRPLAARGVVVIWWLFAIVMSSSYTANLAALYTVVTEKTHINSLADLAAQPSVQPLLQPGSFLNDLFEDAPPGSDLAAVASRLKAVPMPVKAADALLQVRRSDHYVFISDSSQLEYWAAADCHKLVMADERFASQSSFAFPLPKDSPVLTPLNEIIIKFQESGLLDRWHSLWWQSSTSCTPPRTQRPTSIHLPGVSGTFYVTVSGIGLSLVVLSVEIVLDCMLKMSGKEKG